MNFLPTLKIFFARMRPHAFLPLMMLFMLSFNLNAQQLHSSSIKALKCFNQAIKLFNERENEKALSLLQKAIKADRNFIEAYMMMAQINKESGDHQRAIYNFRKALTINPENNPQGHLSLSEYLYQLGRYSEAVEEAVAFENIGRYNSVSRESFKGLLEKYEFALKLYLNPVSFNPINLGDSVNSVLNEYWPSLSVDENRLTFTLALEKPGKGPDGRPQFQEDFYFSEKDDSGNWMLRQNLGSPINTPENEGAQSISSDGRKIYYTHCRPEIDRGNCNIYFSEFLDGKWSLPKPLPFPVNTAYKEKQPSISPDDRVLYFSSDRPGGKGGMDIWVSHKNSDGSWSEPVNSGDSINTIADEQSPFIHADGKTLYFSSDGHMGMGGADIFYSKLDKNGNWTLARNIGYPINTNKTEFGLIVNSSGDKAYFASSREEGRGTDIYEFELYEEARPASVSYMKGRVYDAKTFKGLKANFELYDLETGNLVIDMRSEPSGGGFLVPLPTDRDYALNVSRKSYLFYSENFSFRGIHEKTDPLLKNIALKPIEKGEKIVLRNIFFPFDQWQPEEESKVELKKMLIFLQQNPEIRIEISGHTDNVGSEEYNLLLSQRRADAIADYLIHNNISAERVISKGYGSTEPVASNETEHGRAVNRRTEMKIIP